MRCALLAPQERACVADGRAETLTRSWTARVILLNRSQIVLMEAETAESRAHPFNVVSASPPPICVLPRVSGNNGFGYTVLWHPGAYPIGLGCLGIYQTSTLALWGHN